ncbi:hypothetical protein ASF16_18010 [Acidovorax sp. Leaf78]|nr:hypothetical protein ASF16_18010 [Acidovorax sp. Leaf78]
MGDISGKCSHIVILSRDFHINRKFRIILFHYNSSRAKQVELQTSPQASLINIRKQRSHFSFTWQLLLELNYILLNLFTLSLKSI